jgi:hypothetical protein
VPRAILCDDDHVTRRDLKCCNSSAAAAFVHRAISGSFQSGAEIAEIDGDVSTTGTFRESLRTKPGVISHTHPVETWTKEGVKQQQQQQQQQQWISRNRLGHNWIFQIWFHARTLSPWKLQICFTLL